MWWVLEKWNGMVLQILNVVTIGEICYNFLKNYWETSEFLISEKIVKVDMPELELHGSSSLTFTKRNSCKVFYEKFD